MEKKMWRFPQGQRQHSEVSVLQAFITCRGSLLLEENTNWMPKQTDEFIQRCDKCITYVVVQFYPWFKFYFPLFCGMVMYDNEFDTKEIKI